MKLVLLSCGLAAALPGAAQQPAPRQNTVEAAPADAYGSWLSIGNDVARLLRRALAEPDDAKAIALLNSRATARLKAKAEQLQPSLRSWVSTLSVEQKEAFAQRFLRESPLRQCLDSLERNPASKARLERSRGLQSALQALVYYTL
ncbi:hypothetical protein HHL22_12885 [Hymenobacter sp. RP-2-7]|uniref:Uncharacterized protein n=1 Tax=Hymenobacter polaris TaxID=2682546 RepID=A0A7Y0FMP7_9BACT|nr:hypothetical protein [Hymenobacter polaris]NML66102.1 hypothetical protein [Hymenobacter polaris]